MAIETTCPGCARALRVANEHAGRQARCPMCNTIYTVPGTPAPPITPPATQDDDQWMMRTPEGREYGPVAKPELDRWVSEGRITADCEVCTQRSHSWQRVAAIYPHFGEEATRPKPRDGSGNTTPLQGRVPRVEPHRGPLILALGIMTWVVGCPLFGIFAWTLGSADLRKMQAGQMDREGRSLTQAGQVLGMVHIVLSVAVILLFLGFLLLMAVARW